MTGCCTGDRRQRAVRAPALLRSRGWESRPPQQSPCSLAAFASPTTSTLTTQKRSVCVLVQRLELLPEPFSVKKEDLGTRTTVVCCLQFLCSCTSDLRSNCRTAKRERHCRK
ncbi:UNVERIFIED_CONTAM: hypothetical protein FKN15_043415 [Acipenser sinensis]